MNFAEYQSSAMRTAPEEGQVEGLVHSSLGLATEAGEFTSEVKRMARYGKVMTQEMRDHMIEELGDVLWYVALGCEALGCPMQTAARLNIEKLEKRFPDKFSGTAAEARADKGGAGHRES